jgi:hypothetical protein
MPERTLQLKIPIRHHFYICVYTTGIHRYDKGVHGEREEFKKLT